MSFAKYLVVPLALAISVGCAQSLLAQGTDLGTIRGTVTDPSGAVIANANVTIADLATSTLRHTETNSHGEYQMFGLPSGTYKVTIAAPGMTASDITGIVLSGSDTVNANAAMIIGRSSPENAYRGASTSAKLLATKPKPPSARSAPSIFGR